LRSPHGLAFAGGKLYFTAETNKIIGTYDPGANRVDWLLGAGQNATHMIEVGKGLNVIFPANVRTPDVAPQFQTGGEKWAEPFLSMARASRAGRRAPPAPPAGSLQIPRHREF
jgi:hypothetical protein